MKLVTYDHSGIRSIGALVDSRVIDIPAAHRAINPGAANAEQLPANMIEFLSSGEDAMRMAARAVDHALSAGPEARGRNQESLSFSIDDVRLLAPVQRPGKVLCIGLNYRDHAEEVNMRIPERPILFAKFANAVIGPGEKVILPEVTGEVDYEAELAVVIGRRARSVVEGEALEYVAGYTMVNDVSARDLQLRLGGGQWTWGKTLDTFAPMGPALVTRDEVDDPGGLDITFRLNGQTMQSSNTRNLVFDVPYLISFLSQGITLEPGDVIATGTPAGVGMNRKPPVFLKPGDRMEVEIEKLGVLANQVVAGS